jgi:ribosomal protein S18 acetylase RimI-like enzyme
MDIVFKDTKDLPCDQLHHLFMTAGWVKGPENPDMLRFFNKPFINSTLVISAWGNDRLIGAVRVLSDAIIRSVIYDLVVDPEFQNRGIGKALLKRCIEHFPDTEWLVQTSEDVAGYYEKLGFSRHAGVFLSIPSKYQ